jgi:hypothetical protein
MYTHNQANSTHTIVETIVQYPFSHVREALVMGFMRELDEM